MCVTGLDVLHVVGGGGGAILACGLRCLDLVGRCLSLVVRWLRCLDLFLVMLAVDVREPE